MKWLLFFSLVVVSHLAQAYPEFIGYGYATCITCHFNGQGGGALNDYGRALFSAEISSRYFYSDKKTDEQIADQSGFFGSPKNTPWWIRPGVKYRTLVNNTQVGSSQSQSKTYFMQLDINATILLDQESKNIFAYTLGFAPNTPEAVEKAKYNRFLAKEYYYRGQFAEKNWLYIGMLDKVFGLRNIDHTSYSRGPQRLTLKDDQTLGVVYHYIETNWEATGQYFVGGPYEEESQKLKGYTGKFEVEFAEKQRGGFSLLSQKNQTLKIDLMGIEYRYGFQKGASLMTEFGFITNDNSLLNVRKTGSWFLLETWVPLARGYNFRTLIERYNDDFKPASNDLWRWGAGMMMFPAPRFEVRLDILQGRTLQNTGGSEDQWVAQGQVHVSL